MVISLYYSVRVIRKRESPCKAIIAMKTELEVRAKSKADSMETTGVGCAAAHIQRQELISTTPGSKRQPASVINEEDVTILRAPLTFL